MGTQKVVDFKYWRLLAVLLGIQFIPSTVWRVGAVAVFGLLYVWGQHCNRASFNTLYSLALKDELTGLYNYRYFRTRLEEEVERVRRYGGSLCLLIIDVDRFKPFNDRHGHQRGNEALSQLADIFGRCTRTVDVVNRYGGDEFVIICPNTDLAQARNVAERIRKKVANTVFRHHPGELTVSIGIALYQGENPQEFISRTDAQLYQSKAKGRNSIYVA